MEERPNVFRSMLLTPSAHKLFTTLSAAFQGSGCHPYSDGTNSTAYLTSSPPKAPCSPPHIHTYINASLWKQVATAHPEGGRIKITLNSKQRIEALADRTDSDTGYSVQLFQKKEEAMAEKKICIFKMKGPGKI